MFLIKIESFPVFFIFYHISIYSSDILNSLITPYKIVISPREKHLFYQHFFHKAYLPILICLNDSYISLCFFGPE